MSNPNFPTLRLATLAIVLGAGLVSPAMAAKQDRVRAMPTAQSQTHVRSHAYEPAAFATFGAAYNQAPSEAGQFQGPNFGQGNRCVTDEGNGRWSYCDSN